MPLIGFDSLFQDADTRSGPVAVAVAGAEDRTVLEAARAATDRGWIDAVLVGRGVEIRRLADESDVDPHGFTIIDADEPAAAAVAQVRAGRAEMLMKGRVSTPTLTARSSECTTNSISRLTR